MKKQIFSLDTLHWILGLVISSLGLCLSTKSDLGLSMIGACPYVLHVWLRDALPWFTQGTAEYVWEAIVLLVTCLAVRRFRPRFLLSFLTAVIVGSIIDGWLWVLGGNGAWGSMAGRVASFIAGMVVTSLGVAFFFRTHLPLEVYELAVQQIAERYHLDQNRVKLGFDIASLCVAIALSLLLTHALTGIGLGTVAMTFLNAPLIAFFGRLIDRAEGKG